MTYRLHLHEECSAFEVDIFLSRRVAILGRTNQKNRKFSIAIGK